MNTDFEKMLELMECSFRDFEAAITNKPKLVKRHSNWVYRYVEQTIFQAIVQKLARIQSVLRAALVLLENGYVQEQAMLNRVIDETNEDILFLVYAITNDKITTLHERYLTAFWEEEFEDACDPINSEQRRDMVPRKKIRAYISSVEGAPLDQSTSIALLRAISKVYSGFVHGASPQIMDSFGGQPPHFHTQGMLGTPRIGVYEQNLWSYVYRSFLSHILVAKAFGDEKNLNILMDQKDRFESNAGKKY